ncbi:DUF3558 family protein [Nocardia spumae]|uniref:DUF3558 family protein n=1 Tax=Nocardia spumae TaxID=2887190 RepID=UPI001D153DB8|nr:DUF3558 family protein [Nocardia spumae]
MTAGCGSTTEGTAAPASSDAAAGLWDPCTQIPDSALSAAQVDPSTKESGVAGVEQSGWKICGWKGRRYDVTVYSTHRSASEIANKDGNTNQQPVTIAGRAGTQFAAGFRTGCDVVFAAQQGAAQIQILGRIDDDYPVDPCPTLANVGNSIVPVLPK